MRTAAPTGTLLSGKSDVAHINHYQCRSFLTWMGRVERGDVSFDRSQVPLEHAWRLDDQLCLRQFVETVAKDKNELVDEYMLRFARPVLDYLGARAGSAPSSTPPRLEPAVIGAATDVGGGAATSSRGHPGPARRRFGRSFFLRRGDRV